MSFFKLKPIKKLTHVRKMCKSFTEILQSKVQSIKVRKTVKHITTFLVPSRQRLDIHLMRRRSNASRQYQLVQKGFPAVYIDELRVPKSGQPTTMKDKESDVTIIATSISTTSSNHGKNRATNNNSLLCKNTKDGNTYKNIDWLSKRDIRGVDERAEDFISKVREDMRLEREQSILDFHEMLARSV